jgi:hypothetical protein
MNNQNMGNQSMMNNQNMMMNSYSNPNDQAKLNSLNNLF